MDAKQRVMKAGVEQPEWSWRKEGSFDGRLHQWIKGMDDWQGENPDVVILGLPLSRSSISVSGASEYAEAFRKGWKGFSTYNLDEEIDLSFLTILDTGNVKMHGTDIVESHRRIEQAAQAVFSEFQHSVFAGIGGDHSVTACTVRGLKKIHPDKTIGILQLDTHLDLRDPKENGPSNGTPMRQLIEGGIVKGSNIYTIGLHGYFNAPDLVAYGKKHGVNMISLKKARQNGIVQTVRAALNELSQKTDRTYITIDMDVLDIGFAPGVPASTPGGMSTQELFEALLEIGSHPSLKYIDFVCLDPTKDPASSPTVKAGIYSFLQVVSGMALVRSRKG
ncbi:agmatinase family protein [Jeotgalibacillus proteolyticus]|uniref:agmatinase family protein n=1 Tax=Jeotgalibacillus proteolyticus TaxID=2082395 RepID=UPI003CF429BA